jgi:hypothetical protein
MEMRSMLLNTTGRAILETEWQETWLICVVLLVGQWNLQVMRLDI